MIEIYTDGSCHHVKRIGGWAFVEVGEQPVIFSGKKENTTNNEMELTAIYEALKYVKNKYANKSEGKKSKLNIYTDSAYIVNCMTDKWHIKWQKNGWKTSNGTPVKNKELWEKILALTDIIDTQFHKVEAHVGIKYNEIADTKAREEMEKLVDDTDSDSEPNAKADLDADSKLRNENYLDLSIKENIDKFKNVTIIDPRNTYISKEAIIEDGAVIYPNVFIEGSSKVNTKAVILPGSIVVDSIIGKETSIGPMAHLRPGNVIGEYCKIGSFVEVKNSIIGNRTRAAHLAYIGDVDIANDVNIGCGVVFVNYDGKNKFRSKVGSNAFIGSNVNIVAPVNVAKDSYIAAGSTITKDTNPDVLTIARALQREIEEWERPK